ncbi:hypothetical protein T484DRAFT_1646319, partial [Baffinella frigidus]
MEVNPLTAANPRQWNTLSCDACTNGESSPGNVWACNGCLPGYAYNDDGYSGCLACDAGKYKIGIANTACICRAGYTGGGTLVSCTICPLGTYKTGTGAAGCSACTSGTYSNTDRAAACLACGPNTYNSDAGASACSTCPANAGPNAGRTACVCNAGYQEVSTNPLSYTTVCSDCGVGTYSSAGSSACTPCPEGTFGAQEKLSVCTPCPEGEFSGAGATECGTCHAYSSSISGTTDCACKAGYHKKTPTSACSPCDPGTYKGALGTGSCTACIWETTHSPSFGSTAC